MERDQLAGVLGAKQAIAAAHPDLKLLVLHGSRARGDVHQGSDWDFAYLGGPALDPSLLQADLVLTVGTDHVDLANLATAGGLIRYRVARDGIPVLESAPGIFQSFWSDAVTFWCDAAPVLQRGYETILEGLDR
jgi:hypothetical protein